MVSLDIIFWIFIILFAIIGSMRGWAREILVTFSTILALFILSVMEKFVPFVRDSLLLGNATELFWLRAAVLGALVFFGYQTPKIPRIAATNRFIKDTFQDILLGSFIGAINGYLIFGSLWYFMHQANYPFAMISAPNPMDPLTLKAFEMIKFLPPAWIGPPMIYFAVAISFVFVLVVLV